MIFKSDGPFASKLESFPTPPNETCLPDKHFLPVTDLRHAAFLLARVVPITFPPGFTGIDVRNGLPVAGITTGHLTLILVLVFFEGREKVECVYSMAADVILLQSN